RRDRAVGCDLADPVVARVGEEDASGGQQGDAVREVELGARRRAAVAAVALRAVAGEAGDRPVGPDAPDEALERLDDEDAAVGQDRDAPRLVDLRARGGTAVAAVTGIAVARDGEDRRPGSERCDPAAVMRR